MKYWFGTLNIETVLAILRHPTYIPYHTLRFTGFCFGNWSIGILYRSNKRDN